MAPKKSKGSSSATPIPDEARARAVYKQLSEKKKWIEAVKADAQTSDFIHCLARTRVLLDKQQPEKDSKEKAAFLKVALEVYTKLPDGCEQPPGQQLCSLGMLVARASLLQLLADQQQLKTEQQLAGLVYLAELISRGFTRDGWHKVWFDPRSDNLREEEKSRGSMVAAAAAAADQLLEAWGSYAKVFLTVMLSNENSADPGIKALVDKLPPNVTDVKQPWNAEATAAKDAAKAAKAAEPPKQQNAKKVLQRESKQEQLQQQLQQREQRRAGGRDTERARDIKRSKASQEDQQRQLVFDAARKKEEEAKEDAAKVLDYLEKRLLSGSSSSSPEQHMARLQEESRVSLEVLKKTINSLSNRDAKDKDKQELPQELQWCKQQLGDHSPSDNALKQQLQQLQEKGPSAWLVFYDNTAAAKAGSAGKPPKALYDSWEEFEEHVVNTHLVTAPDNMPLAFSDEASEQLVSDSYKLKGLMQPPLADAAAEAARQGSFDSSSPWVKAFETECPLQRFTRAMANLQTEDASSMGAMTEENVRTYIALGFALLQAERKQVAVDRLQQSRQPAWAVQAYHSLRLLPALNAELDLIDNNHFIIYNYWQSKQACSEDYQRILRPHMHPEAAANGSSDAAASFTDGLAEDNVTMLSMLHKDDLLSGPLLLALQLYLNKAVGKCLDISSSNSSSGGGSGKGKLKRQDGSSGGGAALDPAAALSVLTQLPDRQQVELRQFLLRALFNCYAGLSAYVGFVQQEQQQRKRPQEVPVEVVAVKEKGKDKAELALVLTQDYYEQACVSAAVPEEHHEACCAKHHTLRLQAEADSKPYSKFDSSTWEDFACTVEETGGAIPQADPSVMQRYLLQPARVEEPLEQGQLKVGTQEGLKALVDALFAVGKHEHQRKALLPPPEDPVIKRSPWDKARTDMAIAVQLALHRRQLHALVEDNEEHLSDSNNSQWTRHNLNQRMRSLLLQRNAGAEWVLRMWLEFFKEQLATLRKEDASLQEQLLAVSDVPEKDKAGKGSSKENSKEKEDVLTRKANQVAAAMSTAETAMAHVKSALSKVLTEAEGYPDLIRAYHSSETGQSNPLVQMLTLITNELLGSSQPNTNGAAQQLSEALQLSRLSLFDLDVWVMGHALTARRRVLSSMWRNAQPRAVLALSTEALKSHLKEGISKRAERELLAAEEEFKQTQQQQQPQQGKAAGKKKKKKGAAKQAGPSLMSRIAGSESADEEDEEAAAAKAAAEEEAAKAAAEEDEQQEQEDDGWSVPKIDMSKLDLTGFQSVQQQSKARTDSRDKEHVSMGKAASSQAAAAASAPAAAKPASRGDAAGAAAGARPASSATRGDCSAAAAAAATGGAAADDDEDPIVLGVGVVPTEVCTTCGTVGHSAKACREPYCSQCKKYGHPDGMCNTACANCGKVHRYGRNCRLGPCYACNRWGHERAICPVGVANERCKACNYRGHRARECPGVCRRCDRPGHTTEQCTAKPCPACGKLGHEYGSARCPAQQQSSSSSSSRRPPAAEAGRPGSGSKGAAAAAGAVRPAAAGAAAAAGRRRFNANHAKLLPAEKAQQVQQFIDRLDAAGGAVLDYMISLVGNQHKLAVLCRLTPADLTLVLEQDDPAATLEEVYATFNANRARSLQPLHLVAAGQRAFTAALPTHMCDLLGTGWETALRWDDVAEQLQAEAGREWGDDEHKVFEEAKQKARHAHMEAEAAQKEERAQQETKQQARQQQQQRQPPAPQQQRELERRPSGSGERPGSSGGSSSWGPATQPQATATPTAATADRPAPAKVSFAAASQQAQEQPAAAGISMPPTLVSEHPGYLQQQQQPAVPYAGMPGQPAPAGQPWPPGMGPAGQQLQQQQAGGLAQPQPLPPHAFGGELQPWMMWYTYGATRAINELVADEQLREQVLEAGVRCAPDMEVAPFLRRAVKEIMTQMVRQKQAAHDGFIRLGELVEQATKAGLHPPPPMPSPATQPAPVAALPPHLQRSYQQQPAAGGPTHMLPPHLQQHHHAPQHQQQPLWQAEMQQPQQQQQPAGDDDSDDDDGLMNLLTGSGSGATAAAAAGPSQQQPAWGNAAGQQQHGVSGVGSEFPALGVGRGSGGGGRPAVPGLATAGLANETGEYNCFLNVVVQCLYNCRDFRMSVWELPSYVAENMVVVALRNLFMDMQQAESGWQPGGERAVVNPTALREALGSVTQFKQQEMNDANELLDALYECFKKAQGTSSEPGSRGVLVDSCFGLRVNEAVKCRRPECGKRTHIIGTHWEHMLVVNTMALTFAAYDVQEGCSDMGRLLRTLFDQEMKMCDKDFGGCGTAYPPERACEATPKVLTLQLVWNQDVASSEIEGALQHIQEHVDITPLYAGGCEVADTTYQLSSAVAYYGQHYMAFVHNTKLHTWLLFDDASVSVVGSWQDVIKKCTAGKIQPSVLFYQTVDLAAVGTGARPGAVQSLPQVHLAPAPVPMGMPAGGAAAAGGPGGAPWAARPPAAAMPAGVPPHMAMPPHLQQQQQHQQPHHVYQQRHMLQQQQQPMPAGPYSPPPPQQQQQQQQLAASASGGWPAAATTATDGSGHGGSWHTVQQPADAGAAWGNALPSAAPASTAAQPAHPAAGAPPPSQGPDVAQQYPAKPANSGVAASRGGGTMAAAALRAATGQPSRPGGAGAAPGGGRGSSSGPRTTGLQSNGGRGEGPHGGRGPGGRGPPYKGYGFSTSSTSSSSGGK